MDKQRRLSLRVLALISTETPAHLISPSNGFQELIDFHVLDFLGNLAEFLLPYPIEFLFGFAENLRLLGVIQADGPMEGENHTLAF